MGEGVFVFFFARVYGLRGVVHGKSAVDFEYECPVCCRACGVHAGRATTKLVNVIIPWAAGLMLTFVTELQPLHTADGDDDASDGYFVVVSEAMQCLAGFIVSWRDLAAPLALGVPPTHPVPKHAWS